MFENIVNFFKGLGKSKEDSKSKDAAKERLHLVLMQDRANISADFLALMKQEIIEVIKKYIDVDENAIDVRLTNKSNDDGTTGAPVLYANIPIVSVKEEAKEKVKKDAEAQKEETSIKNEEKKESETKKKTSATKASTKKKETEKEEAKVEEVKEEKADEGKNNENEVTEETKEVIEKAEEIVEEIKEEVSKENSEN